MNIPHLHLLINHFPTIGTIIGFGLLLLSFFRKSDPLKKASLEVFFMIGLLALPAYLSGNAAAVAIQERTDISMDAIRLHQDSALQALFFQELTAVAAWAALWQYRRRSEPRRGTLGTVLILSVVTIALMGRTSNIGGEIHHDEIRADTETLPEPGSSPIDVLKASSLASFVTTYTWVWPTSETVHFIGLCLLMGVLMPMNLRLLGMAKRIPFSALHSLLPWAIVGFALNTVTGMLFFVAAAEQYTLNPAFYLKMAFIFLAGVNLLYLTVFDEPWAVGAGDDASGIDKVMAGSALFLWFGIIFWGNGLPFLGLTF
jgi:uncharacterized membrane protein